MKHFKAFKKMAGVLLTAIMLSSQCLPVQTVMADAPADTVSSMDSAALLTEGNDGVSNPADGESAAHDTTLPWENEYDVTDPADSGAFDADSDSSTGDLQESVDVPDAESDAPEEFTELTSEDAVSELNKAGTPVTGEFPKQAGQDLASVRYLYTENGREIYGLAAVSETESGYTYSFEAPVDGFTAEEGVNVLAEYFSTQRWDGAVDISWYDASQNTFTLTTPAQLAGLAAIVNGGVDGKTPAWRIKGDQSLLQYETVKGFDLPGGVTATVHLGLAENDFSGKTVILGADMDMGGGLVDQSLNAETNAYDYPNWAPIGGEFLMDLDDYSSMNVAYFNGVLDGDGHRITNLYCYRRSYTGGVANAYAYSQGIGFIGMIGTLYTEESEPALVPAVRNVSLSGYVYGRRMVGGLIGGAGTGGDAATKGHKTENGIRVENCANYADVYGTDSKGVGGIAGVSWGKGNIINCYNRGNMTSTYAAPTGGISGSNSMNIYACYNTGTIYTSGNSRGRGISSDNDGSNYSVNDCFYLAGCYDDLTYKGYYTANMSSSVSVVTTEMNRTAMTDGTMLNGLNVNGNAYAAGSDGYPVLLWEKARGTAAFTVSDPEGGSVKASVSQGSYIDGTVVYFEEEAESGWAFRYYTLNGRALSGHYATISGSSTCSAYFEAVRAGVLNITASPVVNISVTKDGTAMVDGTMQQVNNYPVASGDALYENDRLSVNVTLKAGVVPDDTDMVYAASVNAAKPYYYHFTYTGQDTTTQEEKIFNVSSAISAEGVALNLEVEAKTTKKLWSYTADTSWYEAAPTAAAYTIKTPDELAGLAKLVKNGTDFAGKTVFLGNDISLVNTDGTDGRRFWDGIGSPRKENGEYVGAFAGTFDGQGHIISDMHTSDYGLFAAINGGTVKNVTVKGTAQGNSPAGVVSVSKNGTIENVSAYVIINNSLKGGRSGGILGQDAEGSVVRSCFNYGTLTGKNYLGGIVGTLSKTGRVEKCINKGALVMTTKSIDGRLGGVVGECSGTVCEAANYGSITAQGGYSGGLTGLMGKTGSFTDAYNVGDISYEKGVLSFDAVGGIAGSAQYYTLKNVYSLGSATNASDHEIHIGSVFGTVRVQSINTAKNVYYLKNGNKPVMDNDGIKTGITGITDASSADFAASKGVLAGINGNGVFVLTNGRYPELAAAAGSHVHSGGTATCTKQAVCSECGLPYGQVDSTAHGETVLTGKKTPVWNIDGYTGDKVCQECGEIAVKGEVISADVKAKAFTVNIMINGKVVEQVDYTVQQVDDLKTVSPAIGYLYFGGDIRTVMASTEYVTISSILNDLRYLESDLEGITAKGPGVSVTADKAAIESCRYYWDSAGNRYDAPAALAIKYAAGPYDLEMVAKNANVTGTLRFGYGISEEQNKAESLSGGRMISPVTELVLDLAEGAEKQPEVIEREIVRYSGANRYQTCFSTAEAYQKALKKTTFASAVLASGSNFPDALSGVALAIRQEAPMLLANPTDPTETIRYIEKNIEKGGTIYVLGGESSVPSSTENTLKAKGYKVERLSGRNRYATNMEVLKAMKLPSENETLLIASGIGYADALSGAAVGAPIMLIKDSLNDEQLSYIKSHGFRKIYILGGEAALPKTIEDQLKKNGQTNVKRLGGKTRYETSYLIAKEFFGEQPKAITITFGGNFPDGLSGGPIALAHDSPLLLVKDTQLGYVKSLMTSNTSLYILGGESVVSKQMVSELIQ